MRVVSRVTSPVVWLLDVSGNLVLRLLGLGAEPEEDRVTDDDLKSLVAEAERQGTIDTSEKRMIAGVLRLGDRPVKGVMTPRIEVDWIDAAGDEESIRAVLMRTAHSRLPVGDGSPDAAIGVVRSRELLAALLRGETLDIRRLARTAPAVPDNADAIEVLETLRKAEVPMAFVLDEYGHFQGLVTPTDLTGAIVGDFRSDADPGDEAAAVERDDGSWLLAGWMPVDEMAERLHITLPAERGYQTVAGLILDALKRVPQAGEVAQVHGWRFEVVDLDGRRIDKVLATPLRAAAVTHARRLGAGVTPGR
jgi:putative hemolysin